ncbi:MAG: DUF92 domain-containing protein [Bacteroidota bacterium]
MLINNDIIVYLLIIGSSIGAIAWGKIDKLGGIAGCIVTCLLFASSGFYGISLIAVFFLIGTAASLYKINRKTEMRLAEPRRSQRGWKNVLANSGAAAAIALVDIMFHSIPQTELLLAACFAVALSDTLSSEMGNITGRNYFNIISFKLGVRGHDGVVSWEGFAWGLLGSCTIGAIYWFNFHSMYETLLICLVGFLGNVLDSVLGATWQRKGYLNNHTVNLASTTVAVATALIIIFW